jgi:hypothetical protein
MRVILGRGGDQKKRSQIKKTPCFMKAFARNPQARILCAWAQIGVLSDKA